MKHIFSQIIREFNVGLKKSSTCFGIHIQALVKETLSIVVHFRIQVQNFSKRKWRNWPILWQTRSKSYPHGIDKETKDMN